jgi:hypothetical protein
MLEVIMWKRGCWLAAWLLLTSPLPARAGMPDPLPIDPLRTLRLHDSALGRLQAISFFLLAFLLSVTAVWLLWNYLRRDFSSLPRLSFGTALAGVFLWGLLFIIVLTMISGARELMTPGAWQKHGFTYRLARDPAPSPEPDPEADRRRQLEKLRTALWQFAATHQGRFPAASEMTAIPTDLWEVPDSGGMRFLYVPGLSAGHLPEVLACAPELEPGQRLVLRANGDILTVPSDEVPRSLTEGGRR